MYYKCKKLQNKNDIESLSNKHHLTEKIKYDSNYKSIIALLFIFTLSASFLYVIYLKFPSLDKEEKEIIRLPNNLQDAKKIGNVLKKYNEDHFFSVLSAFFSIYVFLQTFAIPGSIFLSILAGFLYPFPLAILMVSTCSAIGASLCYCLSYFIARKLILRIFNEKIILLQKKIKTLNNELFWYIVFLRITPFVPNWLMNLTSPIINIPFIKFLSGTFIGVAPPSLIYIQAGQTLNELTGSYDIFSAKSIICLILVSILSICPIILPKIFPALFGKYTKLFSKD